MACGPIETIRNGKNVIPKQVTCVIGELILFRVIFARICANDLAGCLHFQTKTATRFPTNLEVDRGPSQTDGSLPKPACRFHYCWTGYVFVRGR